MGKSHVALDVQIPSDVRYIEGVIELATRKCRELDHGLYVVDVAWNFYIESDVRSRHQKLSSARSRVSEIWNSVSSLVSSKRV